jgi:hypothetical protein
MPSCWVKPRATRHALQRSMLPSARRLIRYTHLLPTTFIEGWKGTKNQVWLERKTLISSHIASCQTAYLSASEKARGYEEGECITPGEVVTTTMEATRLAVFGCRGWRTIGCLLIKGGNAGEEDGHKISCYSR